MRDTDEPDRLPTLPLDEDDPDALLLLAEEDDDDRLDDADIEPDCDPLKLADDADDDPPDDDP